MSAAGLMMQQLCMNKFVSPTTGATISSAQFGILLALVFMPASTIWSRAIFSAVCAVVGTWMFVWFIQRIQFKDPVMVPLVGIMFGNVIGGITNYIAYKYEMTQAISSWLTGSFSTIIRGRYEIVWMTLPLVIVAFIFANHFNIVGMGKDFSKNLGVNYNGTEIGFENIGVDADIDTSAHGNEASFEFVLDKNPDYIFAMDRDAAIGTNGAQLAAEVLDNELINQTDASKKRKRCRSGASECLVYGRRRYNGFGNHAV